MNVSVQKSASVSPSNTECASSLFKWAVQIWYHITILKKRLIQDKYPADRCTWGPFWKNSNVHSERSTPSRTISSPRLKAARSHPDDLLPTEQTNSDAEKPAKSWNLPLVSGGKKNKNKFRWKRLIDRRWCFSHDGWSEWEIRQH